MNIFPLYISDGVVDCISRRRSNTVANRPTNPPRTNPTTENHCDHIPLLIPWRIVELSTAPRGGVTLVSHSSIECGSANLSKAFVFAPLVEAAATAFDQFVVIFPADNPDNLPSRRRRSRLQFLKQVSQMQSRHQPTSQRSDNGHSTPSRTSSGISVSFIHLS